MFSDDMQIFLCWFFKEGVNRDTLRVILCLLELYHRTLLWIYIIEQIIF